MLRPFSAEVESTTGASPVTTSSSLAETWSCNCTVVAESSLTVASFSTVVKPDRLPRTL